MQYMYSTCFLELINFVLTMVALSFATVNLLAIRLYSDIFYIKFVAK